MAATEHLKQVEYALKRAADAEPRLKEECMKLSATVVLMQIELDLGTYRTPRERERE
jgi:hypothetical protein